MDIIQEEMNGATNPVIINSQINEVIVHFGAGDHVCLVLRLWHTECRVWWPREAQAAKVVAEEGERTTTSWLET